MSANVFVLLLLGGIAVVLVGMYLRNYVLGNHDWGHVGGPHPAKFHDDEVTWLEASLDEPARARMKDFFGRALLAVVAPAGLLLCHGSPDDSLGALDELDGISLDPARNDPLQNHILRSMLTSYGQAAETSARLLRSLSRERLALSVVVHGHDRDEAGWFTEGENQVCPVIFGAPRAQKNYLRLDLAARYRGAQDLRLGAEVLPVHQASPTSRSGS